MLKYCILMNNDHSGAWVGRLGWTRVSGGRGGGGGGGDEECCGPRVALGAFRGREGVQKHPWDAQESFGKK